MTVQTLYHNQMENQYNVIGIDVSSEKLDAYLLPKNEYQLFENNKKGHKLLAKWAKQNNVNIVVCENTGGYENAMLMTLIETEIPVRAINPKQIKRYIESLGTVAKTDKTDAKRIAQFALERKPEPMQTLLKEQFALKEKIAFYRQLVKQRSRLKCQVKQTTELFVTKKIKSMIKFLDKQIAEVKKDLECFVTENSDWKGEQEVLESIPGIGKIVSVTLIAEMPELGEGNAESICALAGVVPLTFKSGKWKGVSMIMGGRASVRSALFEAAGAAVHFCKKENVFRRLYERLRERGKSYKEAMVAVMHKMLRIAHALLKKGEKWNPNFA